MAPFDVGKRYSRPDVKERVGIARTAKGGNWDTGIVEHASTFFIFANVGVEGRTGHDYGNRWEAGRLRWYHKSGSHLGQPRVQRLLRRESVRHVFWRASNDEPFIYAGLGRVAELTDTTPVEVVWSFERDDVEVAPVHSAEQIAGPGYREGSLRVVTVNAYERNAAARQACIAHFGDCCSVCDLDFRQRYGALGAGFIHVHHLVPVSQLGAEYELNPLEDLRPVCPNCHAMLHRALPPLSIEALRSLLRR